MRSTPPFFGKMNGFAPNWQGFRHEGRRPTTSRPRLSFWAPRLAKKYFPFTLPWKFSPPIHTIGKSIVKLFDGTPIRLHLQQPEKINSIQNRWLYQKIPIENSTWERKMNPPGPCEPPPFLTVRRNILQTDFHRPSLLYQPIETMNIFKNGTPFA